jgi:predicted GIY-YIG superfamily endonuclease
LDRHGQTLRGLAMTRLFNGTALMISAIEREKQIKAGSRKKKIALIEKMNPGWLDLYETLL